MRNFFAHKIYEKIKKNNIFFKSRFLNEKDFLGFQ